MRGNIAVGGGAALVIGILLGVIADPDALDEIVGSADVLDRNRTAAAV